MHNDLMLFYSFYFFVILLILLTYGQQTIIYVKRGDTIELCDNRTTFIYAYEYRSFDGKKNLILEPTRHERYSNPYRTSLLRITNVIESDSGQYKCPQDDIEWQKLQVYVPVQHVYLTNLHTSSHVHTMVEGESLDVGCAADGSPRPAVDISLDKNGTIPTIMALANGIQTPSIVNDQFKPSVYEAYRIIGLTALDNGRNITCQVDMKQIDKKLILSTTKQLYIEFRPNVAEKSKKIYCGINQTRTVNCTVIRANPPYIRYSINGLSPSVIRRTYGDQHDFLYTFDITPTSIEHFRSFNVTANNSIGFDTCTYELIHGGVPDAITHCTTDTYTSNVTITISCTKSYAQGDNDGYACTLFKYNDKPNKKMFEEIARTKSCIFALENFHEPVEFRVAAFNRYGSLPPNTYGYVIRLNEPILQRETPFVNKRIIIIVGGIFGGTLLLFFLCCLCGACNRDQAKLMNKADYYHRTNETISHLVPNGNDKRPHQSSGGSLNSIPTRTRTVNNKFYDHPIIDNKYGSPLSPTTMVVPINNNKKKTENDDEEGNESPVYSTTTDVLSESGSFLVPTSSLSKRCIPPQTKPRYSTLSSLRLPIENLDKSPLPLPKPRSRSNSRTRLNNPNSDNSSFLYEERPVSSTDSGMGQSDVVCLPNGDTIRSGLVKSRQNSLQKHYVTPSSIQQQPKYQTLTSPVVHGTEC
ncbi:unnamed protein product [Rotaria sordida]|uniref:Ig-like domain-containing protein n=1 Tax=Rotaria sordida TaxID=392033 RepID=A0A815YQP9_9BILA|nr:unnamed protein product [Rotaria sordida]